MKIVLIVLAMLLAGCGPLRYEECTVTAVSIEANASETRVDVLVQSAGGDSKTLRGLSEKQIAEFGRVGTKYHGTLGENYCK